MATIGKDLSYYNKEELYSPTGKRIAICYSEWNAEITEALLKGAVEVLSHVLSPENILIKTVPGSFELPLGAQLLLESQEVDAVICIGSVIRGETSHFDFVCSATSQGIMDVGLKYNAPCVFCVLTDDNIEQSRARAGGKHGNKGTESALVALEMLKLQEELNS